MNVFDPLVGSVSVMNHWFPDPLAPDNGTIRVPYYTNTTMVNPVDEPVERDDAPPGLNLPYKVQIDKKNHGYTVKVGCQVFCVEKKKRMNRLLKAYYKKPHKVVDDWMTKSKLPK